MSPPRRRAPRRLPVPTRDRAHTAAAAGATTPALPLGWVRTVLFLAALTALALPTARAATRFQAGAHVTDITPTQFPVIVNAMFTERTADRAADPLEAKALVLDDGNGRIALCVVDSCMLPRDLIDQAKTLAAQATGIPAERMLVSSTHTHSAPAAMGCLGSRVDPRYAASLPPRIAAAIAGAVSNLAPARIGWTAFDDWDHTFNRRWIRRPDRMLTDPFGDRTVRAHMHPGHESTEVTGPSGPVDPGFSLIAISTPEGRPVAAFGNYSQHYYDSPLLSSDYYGRFARHLAQALGASDRFVAILSQGTSGDQMWMDYGAPRNEIGYDAYAREIATRAHAAWSHIQWHDHVPIRMAERQVELDFRLPDAARIEWARGMTNALGERLPATLPEIYALEAFHLLARPKATLRLQAIALGDLGITAIPNEVYALTGLKLKTRSPFPTTFNISLANGAEGYIPPPEQHALGGYTTWPARTAGLVPQAEPRIVETLLSLLEDLAGSTRRPEPVDHGPYPKAILDSRPLAYWRLDDLSAPVATDASGNGRNATLEPGTAVYLPGAGSGSGISPTPALTPSRFSGYLINRAIATAGGRLRSDLPVGPRFTVEFWVWNGLPADARPVTGYLLARGPNRPPDAAPAGPAGDALGIVGTDHPDLAGRLFISGGNGHSPFLAGRTRLAFRAWHHVAFVRDGSRVRVHLDGRPDPEIDADLPSDVPPASNTPPASTATAELFLGGRNDGVLGLEGRLDEVAVFDRALPPEEVARHHAAAELPAPAAIEPPLSATESLRRIQVRPGFRVELAAAEPLTVDPVAIDWDAAGRTWVVEMSDYPLGMDGKGKPGGRVRLLEDTNADGRADRSTIFAEGLNFPTGLLVWRDGILVTAPPEILFLRDTDGDGRADSREVVVSGLLEGNQQLRANGLRWGLDNRVHCAAGGHHAGHGTQTRLRTRAGEFHVGSRDFRFDPDTGELEAESGPSQFGRNRDDWDHWFGTQNIRPLWHYVLEDRYLRRNPHLPAPDPTRLVVTPLSPKVWPASAQEKRYHSFNEAGHFTSACSGMIYRDDLLFGPVPDSRRHAFTCEPFHNLVQHNVLSEDGVSFRASRDPAEEGREFFASSDRWCRPVMTRTGPDGALWVVDMYRYMIEHPEWLPAEGRAELLPHYRLGDDRGRLYRVLPTNAVARPIQPLDRLDAPALVAALESPNEWRRDTAHRLLLHRADPAALPPLLATAHRTQHPLARSHALSILDGLHRLEPATLAAALADPHPGVRIRALRLAERHGPPTPGLVQAATQLTADPDPKVRLQLALTLGEWPHPDAGHALARLALADHADPFLLAAILSSAIPHLPALATAAAQAPEPAASTLGLPLVDLALALQHRPALATLLEPQLPTAPDTATPAQLSSLAAFLRTASRRAISLDSMSDQDDALAAAWRAFPLAVAAAESWLERTDAPLPTHLAALTLLGWHPPSREKALAALGRWLNPNQPPERQQAALRIATDLGDPRTPALLLASFDQQTPALRTAIVDALLTREPWTRELLEVAGRRTLPVLDATRRARLERHASTRVRELAAGLLQPAPARAEVVRRFQPALALTGDPERGRAVHLRLCAPCHRLGDVGQEIGPDLASVTSHPPEKLLVNILDPNADIQPGFQAFIAELSDGSELQGLITAETANSLTFRLTDGSTRTLRRTEVATLRGGNLSLMPEGLEEGLTPADLADLIRFLRTPTPR